MMLFFLYLTFAYGTSMQLDSEQSGMVARMFADPKKFVSTFQNAKPDEIDQVISILQALMDEGAQAKATAEQDYQTALKDYQDYQNAEAKVRQDLSLLVGNQVTQTAKVSQAEVLRDQALEDKNLKFAAKENTETLLQKATSAHSQQVVLAQQQDATLKEIESLLQKLLDREESFIGLRSLLAVVGAHDTVNTKVNPETIAKIQTIIDKIREEDKDLLASLKLAVDSKRNDLETVTNEYNQAVQSHLTLSQSYDKEVENLNNLDKSVASAQLELKQKEQATADGKIVLDDKETTRDTIAQTTDRENEVIQDVIEKLKTIK